MDWLVSMVMCFIDLLHSLFCHMNAPATTVVYAGRGSSHSWAWLADLFETRGVLNVRFLGSEEFISSLADGSAGMAVISGGDGYGLAESLGAEGFKRLREFIAKGGRFAGICAGAYLPLHSSVEPFSDFNISTTKIENIRCDADNCCLCDSREAVPYGSCMIFHPVRGPVHVSDGSGKSLIAPMFGGPVFKEPDKDTVLMRYVSFTPLTQFQVGMDMARSLMIGKPAAIRAACGKGSLVLLGPHLEHPRYPEANQLFLELVGLGESHRLYARSVPPPEAEDPSGLRRPITDLKIAIFGLENRSFTVGHKAWDGTRLLELVHAIEERAWTLDDRHAEEIASALDRTRELLLTMEVGSDSEADETVVLLVESARVCVDNHFVVLSGEAGRGENESFE